MLQINVQPYASDALEDAMRLAQTKALNSFTFSDCLNYLNYAWSDIYNRIANIDAGYYSRRVRITQRHTKLPPYVKNTILIYRAQSENDHSRQVYKASGNNDYNASGTYNIHGTELFVPDAEYSNIWMEYVPACPFITFTKNNRDPVLHDEYEVTPTDDWLLYHMYKLNITRTEDQSAIIGLELEHRSTHAKKDITDIVLKEGYNIDFIKCDYPYIFISYSNDWEHICGFFDSNLDFNRWNGFDFTGRPTNVELLDAHYNDKTGLGIVIKDYNDHERIKELGWTPDTLLIYPAPEVYRYLVARLADKLSALNESNVMGVQKELVEARYAFEAFLKKDKAAWQRINIVNGPTIADQII